jgi:hypothetical protein
MYCGSAVLWSFATVSLSRVYSDWLVGLWNLVFLHVAYCLPGLHGFSSNSQDLPRKPANCARASTAALLIWPVRMHTSTTYTLLLMLSRFDSAILHFSIPRLHHTLLFQMYLRELPSPLLSDALYDEWHAAVALADHNERLIAIKVQWFTHCFFYIHYYLRNSQNLPCFVGSDWSAAPRELHYPQVLNSVLCSSCRGMIHIVFLCTYLVTIIPDRAAFW